MLFLVVTGSHVLTGPLETRHLHLFTGPRGGQPTPTAVAPELAHSESSSEVDAEVMQTTAPAAWKRRLAHSQSQVMYSFISK